MRFDQLNIPAFGPFSDFSLELPSSKYDVHLIYGANEAGKSSLLRAIRHLFFGIPTRTTDNFLHQNAKLLIGATISQEENQLSFFRKKGSKNTLLDGGRGSLPDSALESFLGAVNEEFFENMFGLDTDSLRKGAAKLLSGEGDLGTAIFSASLGGSPIDDAIKSLEAEANLLSKGGSRKTTIAMAITAFKEAERAAKGESTTATAWKFLKSEIATSKEAFDEKDRLLREHRLRWSFVDNALRAFPVLAAITELRERLAELTGPELPSDFAMRVRGLEKAFSESSQAFRLQESQIETTQRNLEMIPEYASVMACAPDLEILHRRAEKYLEDLEALPALEARVTSLQDHLDGEDDPEKYPPVRAGDLALAKEATANLEEVNSRSAEVARELENLEIELKSQREQLANLRTATDLDELEDRCRRLDTFAVEYQQLNGLEKKSGHLWREQEELVERLAITGDPLKIKVAGVKVIQDEERQRLQLVEKLRELENRATDIRDELTGERASLSHLVSQAPVYSLADLVKSRAERDELWQAILKSGKVEQGLGKAIELTDTIADALRDDADHIAKAAGHQAKIGALEARQGDLESDLASWQQRLTDWTAGWESRYAVAPGQSPTELLEWRDDWEKLCELVRQASECSIQISAIREQEAALVKEWGGTNFGQISRATRSALNKANQEQGEWSAIQKLVSKNEVRIEQLTGESKTLAKKLAESQQAWKAACHATGLSDEISPSTALETLAERSRYREEILKYRELKQILETKKNSVDDYRKLLEATAETLKAAPSEPVLHRLYEEAVGHRNRAETLQSQLAEFEEALPALRLECESHQATRTALQEQAGSADLESVLLELEKRQSLSARLEEQETTLKNLAGARPVSDFVAEMETVEIEALSEEKASLEEQERHLQGERDFAKGEYDGHLRRQSDLMKASDLAASYQQAAADALSSIVADTERFRQLHYAIDFLKQQVEAYRQETQGPMIEKTSRFFRQLTGGAFEKVAAQLDEKGSPQLIALRAGGESVGTTGLSEGTADQLYLALRLAAIDLHLENHPAIPLILDDLLMTFDDARTRALLPVLQELSRKTQILIFTHHSHLKELVGSDVVVHELKDAQ
ncbi:AAA family ATPase [Verrucomicrobiaceae bacterium 227]